MGKYVRFYPLLVFFKKKLTVKNNSNIVITYKICDANTTKARKG